MRTRKSAKWASRIVALSADEAIGRPPRERPEAEDEAEARPPAGGELAGVRGEVAPSALTAGPTSQPRSQPRECGARVEVEAQGHRGPAVST